MSTTPVPFPCLAFHNNFHNNTENPSTVLFTVSGKEPIVNADIGELENMSVCATTHGFMLAWDPISEETFLWSPHTSTKIELPPLELEADELMDCACLLSDKPTAPGCVALVVEPNTTFIWYCRVGDDDHWGKHDYDIGAIDVPEMNYYEKNVICPIAACRGKFYFNGTPTSLGVIDFSGPAAPEFSSIAIEETIHESFGYGGEYAAANYFLVESNDELSWMDFSARRWCTVDDLGDRSFFLSLFYCGVSCSGCGDYLQRNRVYFVLPRQKVLQIFDVKDESPELQSLDEAPTSDKALWVLPADL
ncbi:hypothetical protein BRADI_2g16990v3 [Brachypodium distachyon]|uniref:KIB1-4 beta-propeller domain-containing protein n=1 Tax=Brachypodium distachyon TaxID=15368 RepID=A0A0Q3IWY6_BRADI|nr:hypothetical protein BRADI_2g16990v3 [Brachypodium distachyon]